MDGRMTRRRPPAAAVRLLALTAWMTACSPPGFEAIVDLVESFPLAEVVAETPLIDFGTQDARSRLGTGWSWNETAADGMTFVWGVGEESWLELFLAEPRELRAVLRCFPYTFRGGARQSVAVAVNGRDLATLELRPEAAEYELTLPAGHLRAGTNRLTFGYAHSQAPAAVSGSPDRRPLAVGWDYLRLENVGEPGEPAARSDEEPPELYVPFGTEVAYYFKLPDAARLTVEKLSVRGDGRLQVLWQVDGEEDRELPLGRTAELPGDGRAARLTLRAVGSPPGDGSWSGARLARPTLRWRPPLPDRPAPRRRPSPVAAASEPPPDVLVYLVDTLRADRLGCYGQSLPLTPHVDELAAEGVVFERALAQTSWTKPAVASILTGLGPLRHGVNEVSDALPEAARTLAERLGDAGYRTAAFVTNAYLTEPAGFAQGFDHFDRSEDPARELNARILSWLEAGGRQRRPFFVYVHTIDPHEPYEPLAPFRERFASAVTDRAVGTVEHIRALAARKIETTPAVTDALLQLYNAEVAQNDAAFGALREGLRQRGLDAGTVIVFLSDHGEAFREHGAFGHGWDLYRQVLDVPLVLRLPDGPQGLRVSEVVQQVDLAPTLLDALGLAEPGDGDLQGRSLLPLVRGAGLRRPQPVFSYMNHQEREGLSVVWEDWKLIEPLGSRFAARRQLFRPWRDPLESRDLTSELPILSGYLAAMGRGELLRPGQTLPEARVDFDDETREALRALGYLR